MPGLPKKKKKTVSCLELSSYRRFANLSLYYGCTSCSSGLRMGVFDLGKNDFVLSLSSNCR